MMELNEYMIDRQLIYEGQIITVSKDTVRLPNQQQSSREVVRHCPAVCILAITPDEQVVLVKQFRYPTNEVLLEIPAGKMDEAHESPQQCAYRELAEETPYTTTKLQLIQCFYTAPGFCDELMYLFYTDDLQANSTLQCDPDEFVETVLLSKEETRNAIYNQQIRDAKTLIALQHWLLQ